MSLQILIRRHSGFVSKQFRMCSRCHLIKKLNNFYPNQWICLSCRKTSSNSRPKPKYESQNFCSHCELFFNKNIKRCIKCNLKLRTTPAYYGKDRKKEVHRY